MVPVRQMLVSSSKYNVKCPYSMIPNTVTVHNTYNDASAENEVKYMIGNNNKVSFHYAVDDKEVVQGIPENRNAWHSGDGNGNGNRKSISVEICYSKSGGDRFNKAEKNAAEFIASILKRKGWGIEKVKKHQDWSGKYCPHRTLDLGWERFLNLIRGYLGQPTVSQSPTQQKPSSSYNGNSLVDYLNSIGKDSSFAARKKYAAQYGIKNYEGISAQNTLLLNKMRGSNTNNSNPIVKVGVDGKWGKKTTMLTQKLLGTYADGIVSKQPPSNKKYLKNALTESWEFTTGYKGGSAMIKALQRLVEAVDDGYFGEKSVKALQNFLIRNGYSVGRSGADGYMGYDTVCAWQRYLNDH